jgi:uncharacterized protein (DUF1330 family)
MGRASMITIHAKTGRSYLLSSDQIAQAHTWEKSGKFTMLEIVIRPHELLVLEFADEHKASEAFHKLEAGMSGTSNVSITE